MARTHSQPDFSACAYVAEFTDDGLDRRFRLHAAFRGGSEWAGGGRTTRTVSQNVAHILTRTHTRTYIVQCKSASGALLARQPIHCARR